MVINHFLPTYVQLQLLLLFSAVTNVSLHASTNLISILLIQENLANILADIITIEMQYCRYIDYHNIVFNIMFDNNIKFLILLYYHMHKYG